MRKLITEEERIGEQTLTFSSRSDSRPGAHFPATREEEETTNKSDSQYLDP